MKPLILQVIKLKQKIFLKNLYTYEISCPNTNIAVIKKY